jgi:hypothetical protein
VKERPLCIVVMAPGEAFERVVAPAVVDAGLEPRRAEGPLLDHLVLTDFAVVDLAGADARRFYELGVRHAVRPHATVLVGDDKVDFAFSRVLPYEKAQITHALRQARESSGDRPVWALIDDLPAGEIDRLKTDQFRMLMSYSLRMKARLERARRDGAEAVAQIEAELPELEDVEVGVLIDVMLSYRAVSAWEHMLALIERFPESLKRTVMVREQYGFGLNRAGRGREAETVLREVIDEHGASSETCALLGRVYKDRWEAERDGDVTRARDLLGLAVDAYRRGFEADWRDAYPGVNAVTLMEIRDPQSDEQHELMPLVRYANRRRVAADPDYWDHATRLELAVIARDHEDAQAGARDALALVRERWEPESTAYNLALIREARAVHGERLEWADAIEDELRRAGP